MNIQATYGEVMFTKLILGVFLVILTSCSDRNKFESYDLTSEAVTSNSDLIRIRVYKNSGESWESGFGIGSTTQCKGSSHYRNLYYFPSINKFVGTSFLDIDYVNPSFWYRNDTLFMNGKTDPGLAIYFDETQTLKTVEMFPDSLWGASGMYTNVLETKELSNIQFDAFSNLLKSVKYDGSVDSIFLNIPDTIKYFTRLAYSPMNNQVNIIYNKRTESGSYTDSMIVYEYSLLADSVITRDTVYVNGSSRASKFLYYNDVVEVWYGEESCNVFSSDLKYELETKTCIAGKSLLNQINDSTYINNRTNDTLYLPSANEIWNENPTVTEPNVNWSC